MNILDWVLIALVGYFIYLLIKLWAGDTPSFDEEVNGEGSGN